MADEPAIWWVAVLRATEKALYCEFGAVQAWIPKSQLQPGTGVAEAGDEGPLVMPAWLTKTRGLA